MEALELEHGSTVTTWKGGGERGTRKGLAPVEE